MYEVGGTLQSIREAAIPGITVDIVHRAAEDPFVTSITANAITTASSSHILNALLNNNSRAFESLSFSIRSGQQTNEQPVNDSH